MAETENKYYNPTVRTETMAGETILRHLNEILEDAYSRGYNDGRIAGSEEAYEEACKTKYDEGYEEGYKKAWADIRESKTDD